MTIYQVIYINPENSMEPDITNYELPSDAEYDFKDALRQLKGEFDSFDEVDNGQTILFHNNDDPDVTIAMLKLVTAKVD